MGRVRAPSPNRAEPAVRHDISAFTLVDSDGQQGRAHSVWGAELDVPVCRGQGTRRRAATDNGGVAGFAARGLLVAGDAGGRPATPAACSPGLRRPHRRLGAGSGPTRTQAGGRRHRDQRLTGDRTRSGASSSVQAHWLPHEVSGINVCLEFRGLSVAWTPRMSERRVQDRGFRVPGFRRQV